MTIYVLVCVHSDYFALRTECLESKKRDEDDDERERERESEEETENCLHAMIAKA